VNNNNTSLILHCLRQAKLIAYKFFLLKTAIPTHILAKIWEFCLRLNHQCWDLKTEYPELTNHDFFLAVTQPIWQYANVLDGARGRGKWTDNLWWQYCACIVNIRKSKVKQVEDCKYTACLSVKSSYSTHPNDHMSLQITMDKTIKINLLLYYT